MPAEGEAGEPPADLVARLQAAQTAWRQAGGCPTTRWRRSTSASRARATGPSSAFPGALEGTDFDPEASRRKAEKLVVRVEGLLAELLPGGGAPPPQTAEELASRLRDALATNTIGGRAAVEAKWHSASTEVESAQAAWKRIGPVPGAEGRDLAARFERACRRFFEERPKPTKTEWSERPRGERSERGERGGRGPRPRFDRPDRR